VTLDWTALPIVLSCDVGMATPTVPCTSKSPQPLPAASVGVIIEARRYLLARGGDLVLRAPVPGYFRVLAHWMREGGFAIEDAPPVE